MMKNRILKNCFVLLLGVLLFGCAAPTKKAEQKPPVKSEVKETVEINKEAKLLFNTLEEMGDYVNSRNFPSLIKASSVYEELDGNIHVIDLRDKETFAEGHIKGAVNVAFENIPEYMENDIKPFEFDKIVMVCYAGQYSSYTASLLRLMGYGNVYSMRWGMSGWNEKFAGSWLNAVSSDMEDKLVNTENSKADFADLPIIETGKTTGEEVMDERVKAVFSEGLETAVIHNKYVFENPDNYYVINYERKDKYESGHIPGAIRYKPGGTLGILSEMETIPANKEVVIYCATGHNSGFVTAYLRLFGYNAKTLIYGNNGFMFDKMVKEKETLSWLPFTEEEIHNYPYVTN